MVKKADIPKLAIAAALDLAVEKGWRRTSLHDIAERAGIPLADFYRHFATKEAVLGAFVRQIDDAVLRGIDPEEAEEAPRDRLFAVLMRRFDSLSPHKPAVAAILHDLDCDPLVLLCGACRAFNTMAWMLEAAGISSAGLRGRLRAQGLMVIYAAVVRVWLNDDSEDMAQTMAALDKWLHRAEWLEVRSDWRRGLHRRTPPAGDGEDTAAPA